MKVNILSIISALFLILIFILLFIRFIFLESHYVTAGSMKNTLHHGDYILSWKFVTLNKKSPLHFALKRRDIVIFQLPGEKEILIKRLIGLPGETIEFTKDSLIVNGIRLEESYVNKSTYTKSRYFIPEGKLLVLGDYRDNSRDSRKFGLVDISSIMGKVIFIYFPFSRMKWLF